MGMLMPNTWLEEQKKKAAPKPVAEQVEKAIEEIEKSETTAKKAGGRRKTSK